MVGTTGLLVPLLIDVAPLQTSFFDVAFIVFIIGLLLTMTGAFGEPNLIIVGLAVTIAALIGMLLGPYSTPIVVGALIPLVGFLLYYVYRFVEFPRSRGPQQTSSASSLLGASGRVIETATPRGGAIELDGGGFDPHYRCRTTEATIPAGERAVVIDPGGGNVLTVVPEEAFDPDRLTPVDADEAGWKVVSDLREAIGGAIGRDPRE